jgi:hypothetical protein
MANEPGQFRLTDSAVRALRDQAQDKTKPTAQLVAEALNLPASDVTAVAPRTREWARLAGPFGWFVLCVSAMIFLLPFFLIAGIDGLEPMERIDAATNWGTHVLAAVVGFTASVVAYFFGASAKADA